jgi:hypothetical protein
VTNSQNTLELQIAQGLTLTVRRDTPKGAYRLGIYLSAQRGPLEMPKMISFQPFSPEHAQIGSFVEDPTIWIGSTSYKMSAKQLEQVADFIGLRLPHARKEASQS